MEIVDAVAEGDGYLVVTLKEGVEDYSGVAGDLVAAGHRITLFREEEVNLESAFMALTKAMKTPKNEENTPGEASSQ